MASDCPEPEVCRRCRKEGHIKVSFLLLFVDFEREPNLKDDCPEPEKCFNCRQEGHSSADCPEPELCRKCRKPVSEIQFLSISMKFVWKFAPLFINCMGWSVCFTMVKLILDVVAY